MVHLVGFIFVLLTVLAAGRFLLLAFHTRQLPEFLLGLTALGLGTSVIAGLSGNHPWPEIGRAVSATAAVTNVLFVSSLLSAWRKTAAAISVLILGAGLVAALSGGEHGTLAWYGRLFACAAGFSWGGIAFGTHASNLRKRARLGLSSPLEVAAFTSLAIGECALAAALLTRIVGFEMGYGPLQLAELQLPFAILGAAAGWVGLAPPHWLRVRLQAEFAVR